MRFAVDLQNKTGKSYLSYTSIKIAIEDMVSFEAYCRGTYYKDSEALTFGSAYDCLLFEPEKFDERFIVMDDSKIVAEIGGGNPRITKAYKEWKANFKDNVGGKRILSMDDNQMAIDMINELVQEAEIGKVYNGTVRKIMDFGAFVEILPGTDGLIHISQLDKARVNKVTDILNEGDEVRVKVLDVDRNGKISLSRKAVLDDERDVP